MDTDKSNMIMPVSTMYGGNNGGFGWGGDSSWWVILFLFALMGNGFGGWGGFGGFGGLGMMDGILPYFYNTQTQNDVNRGFDNIGLSNQLNGIQSAVTSGFGDTALGIAGINQNICQTRGNQAILDKLCQLELDGVKAQVAQKDDIIAQLRSEAMYAKGEASRLANADQIVDNIYNRLNNCPVGTTPVYGRTPIFTCNNNNCGCGSF